MTIIFEHYGSGDPGTVNWRVEILPESTSEFTLVRFRKATAQRKLLDKVAVWRSDKRWEPWRWIPTPPIVPKWLIERVEAALPQGLES